MKIPKYSKRSSGQARFRLHGETFYLGPFGSKESKAEYKRLVSEYIANDGVAVRDASTGDLTTSEMFAAYIAWA